MFRIVHAEITGRVQGVFYRSWTESEARRRALRGWVRNRRNGSVEAVFAGDESVVNDMLNACREGPPAARVTNVNVLETTSDSADIPESFEVRPTE